MDRRTLIVSGLISAVGAPALAQQSDDQPYQPRQADHPQEDHPRGDPPQGDNPRGDAQRGQQTGPGGSRAQTYSREEMVNKVSDFMGVTAEAAGGAIERIFQDNGRPTGYIAGEEGSGAFGVGLKYGRGLLYMKQRPTQEVFWQGPSLGFDIGGNASRVFTLCYNLQYPDALYRRFPGVEGTAYLVGGLGVQYQRADDVILAPIRAGVGVRLGANLGWLGYSRRRKVMPF